MARARKPAGITILSGGQSGVDRAALDVALRLGLRCGGFCPKGRQAEDGPLDLRYPLQETPSAGYAQRTEWNVKGADGTLILTRGLLRGGTALTARLARRHGRPLRVVDLGRRPSPEATRRWIGGFRVLNVAGPRESQSPGIYARASRFLEAVFTSSSVRGSFEATPPAPRDDGRPRT